MKTVILPLILCLLCFFQPLQAQQDCSSAGLNTFSLTYMPTNEPLHARFATQVIQLADGDYATIGLTRKEDGGIPNRYRMFWARFSQAGDLNVAPQQMSIFDLIELDFYYDGFHSPMHLIEACDVNGECEGYYVLATVFSDPEIGGDDTDVILMRLDKEGCLLWVEHFLQFEPQNEFARGLFHLETGQLACFIQHGDAAQNFSNLSVVLATPGDPGCEASFEYIIPAANPLLFESLTVTELRDMPNPDARFAIAGRVRGIDGNPWVGILLLDQSFEIINGFIPLYDLDGQTFTVENPRDIEQDKEFLIITGNKQEFDPAIPPGLNGTGFLMKVEPFDNGGNATYNLHWAHEYDLPNMFDALESDRFRSLEVTEEGYAIGGYSIAPNNQGLALLMGTDKEGGPAWINRYLEPTVRLSGLDDMKIVEDGGFLMGGTRWAPPGNGQNGIWLAKTDQQGRYPNCDCFMETDVEIIALSPEEASNDAIREVIDCEPDTWQWICQEWDDVLVYCDQGPPEEPECWEVDSLIVECDSVNFLKYNASFRLRHFGNFLANEALLYNLPAGFNFVHSNGAELPWISLDIAPSVPAGVYSTPLPFMIVSDNPINAPTEVCFSISPSGLNEDGLWECCFSDSTVCIILEPCCDPCEEIDLSINEVSKDSCCFSLNLDNLCPIATFSSIETEILTPGVTFGSHSFGGPTAANWNNPIIQPQLIRWAHNSGTIPISSFPGLINFCLDNITTDAQIPQTVLVSYIETLPTGAEVVACTDTLIFQCPKTDYPCVELEDYVIECTDVPGTYDFDFNFINISDHVAHFLDISVVAPVGVNVVPDGVLIPGGLNPGDVGTGSVQIEGGTPGGTVILQMRLEDLFSGDGWCCIESDTFEIELPFCEETCPPCENNILRNAGFEIPDPFPAAEWIRPFETGSTPGVTNNLWCSGDWSVIIQGNTDVPEIMAQVLDPAIRLDRTYSLRFCASTSDPDVQFQFRASNNLPTDFSCVGFDCAIIGNSPTINPDGEWACYEVPLWTSPNDFEYFVFHVESPGGPAVAFIDDICLVETGNAGGGSSLQASFFPNPTRDLVNIMVEVAIQDDLTAVITDLYGNPLQTKLLAKGTQHWQLDTTSLPAGVYFVSLKRGTEVLSTERMVKQ